MNRVYIDSVGLVAPGLLGWQEGKDVLNSQRAYNPEPLARYKPLLLPANERRRATELVRLAFRVCEDAVDALEGRDITQLASLFCSAGGDYQVIDQICRVLTEAEPMVSPTQFHNSVHNSAAGYWAIATGARTASSSIAANKFSFTASLLEAYSFVLVEQQDLLLSCYESMPPEPLAQECGVKSPFASAYVLSANQTEQSLASIELSIVDENIAGSNSGCKNTDLVALMKTSPAAQALPLLELLAAGEEGELVLPLNDEQKLLVRVCSC